MTEAQTNPATTQTFPFSIEDLEYWLIQREDGTVVKFTVDNRRSAVGTTSSPYTSPAKSTSLSAYCKHDPAKEPVFATDQIHLFIADAPGTRTHRRLFDLVIDGGEVLTKWVVSSKAPEPKLTGDDELVQALIQFETRIVPEREPRVLRIDWADRQAPPVVPEFWPELASILAGMGSPDQPLRVLTCCQGGHGRSGTSLTALMMCLTDYTPLEAICHLRAIHCARAIESAVQHDYLNALAKTLGRDANAHEAEKVSDFRERFLTLDNPIAASYQARLRAGI